LDQLEIHSQGVRRDFWSNWNFGYAIETKILISWG